METTPPNTAGLFRVLGSRSPMYEGIMSQLDAQSIIRLSWTCKTLMSIPKTEWDGKKMLKWFVQDSDALSTAMKATRSSATGNCLVEFFDRKPRLGTLEMWIFVDSLEGFKIMTRVFLDEDYELEEAHENCTPEAPFPQGLELKSSGRGKRLRNVTICQCRGRSDTHAVLMAQSTVDAVILTSNTVVCMYPLLWLVRGYAHAFDRKSIGPMAEYIWMVLVSVRPPASAMASEFGIERWVGDRRCFSIPLEGEKTHLGKEWILKTCAEATVQYKGWLLSGPWASLSCVIASLDSGRGSSAKCPVVLIILVILCCDVMIVWRGLEM